MPQNVKVDTILMKEWPGAPKLPGLKTEPCFGEWSLVKMMDTFAMDRKIHAAEEFLFHGYGSQDDVSWVPWEEKVQSALKRMLGRGKLQNFNGPKVTDITARRFLDVPYVTVSAHSRHMQQSCNLDNSEARHRFQHDAECARG